jgi:hypothetical protein
MGQDIFIDPSGALLVAGIFSDTVDFDPGPGVFNLIAKNDQNAFLLKLTLDGDFLWAKQTGGGTYSIAVDNKGNISLTGGFDKTVDFDPGPGVFNLTTTDHQSAFLCNLDSLGNFKWAVKFEGGSSGVGIISGVSVSVDKSGNIYSGGDFTYPPDLDPGPAILKPPFGSGTYCTKFSASGDFIFGKFIATYISSMVANDSGIYIGGIYATPLDCDPGPNIYTLQPFKNWDVALVKLTTSGDFVWATRFGGDGFERLRNLNTDPSGNVYLTGTFQGLCDFNPDQGSYKIPGNDQADIFITGYTNSGKFSWAKAMGGKKNEDTGYSVTADHLNNVYTSGIFYDTVDFNGGADTYNLISSIYSNGFLHKMSPCTQIFSTIKAEACNAYTVNNQTYYTSDIYHQSFNSFSGCDSILNIELTINRASAFIYGWGDSLTVLHSNTTDTIFQWIDCNKGGAIIPGEINQVFYPLHSGNYAVIVSNQKCIDTSACYSFIKTGIDTEGDDSIKMYPNPAQDQLMISIEWPRATVKIISVTGEILLKKTLDDNRISIPIAGLANAVYIVEIQQGERLLRKKFVKQ